MIKLQHIHTEQTHSKYAKMSFEGIVKYKLLIFMIMQIKTKQNNLKWPYIPDHPYRILIIGASG